MKKKNRIKLEQMSAEVFQYIKYDVFGRPIYVKPKSAYRSMMRKGQHVKIEDYTADGNRIIVRKWVPVTLRIVYKYMVKNLSTDQKKKIETKEKKQNLFTKYWNKVWKQ